VNSFLPNFSQKLTSYINHFQTIIPEALVASATAVQRSGEAENFAPSDPGSETGRRSSPEFEPGRGLGRARRESREAFAEGSAQTLRKRNRTAGSSTGT